MKDEYDVIVERTVRDLFKSTPLIQIKKYKMNKEKEIMNKDDELKKLILEKYSSLINSISALEQISSHLSELQTIRGKLGENLSQLKFDEIINSLEKIKFDDNFIIGDESEKNEKNKIHYDEEFEKINNLLHDKKYNDVINTMTLLKKEILKEERNNESLNKDNYHNVIVDLCEMIMNDFISDVKLNDNIEQYKVLLDDIKEKLFINDETIEKLQMSEFYLKISFDENIKEIFEKYFAFEKNDKTSNFSVNLLIKLLLLKICQNLYLLSQCKDDNFINDDNSKMIYNMYKMILSVIIITNRYVIQDNSNINSFKEKINKFLIFVKSEITTNISTLLVISQKKNEKIIVRCDELIKFWNNIFNLINSNKSENEEQINNKLSDLIFENKTNLLNFLLLNKCIDQISNVLSNHLKFYTEEHFQKIKTKKDKTILNIIKQISIFESNPAIKQKIITCVIDQISDLLTKTINNATQNNEYINFITKIFSLSELQTIFNELGQSQIITLINNLTQIYLTNNFSQIETFTKVNFKKFLHFEKFSIEDSNNSQVSISDSLKELLFYFYTFEIKDSTYKIKIYNLIYNVYYEILNDNGTIFNMKILVDLNVLSNLQFKRNNNEQLENFGVLIELIEQKLKMKNNYSEDIEILGKKELEDFFSLPTYYEKEIILPYTKQIQIINPKYNIYRKDPINISSNKINPFLLQKSKISSNKNNPTNQNSTSKLFDLRIDENYLSLRNGKLQNSNSSNNINLPSSNTNNIASTFSQLSGKFFNLNK